MKDDQPLDSEFQYVKKPNLIILARQDDIKGKSPKAKLELLKKLFLGKVQGILGTVRPVYNHHFWQAKNQ
jgi:hypothetical protein